MAQVIKDRKDPISFFFLSAMVKTVIAAFFSKIEVRCADNLPKSGPFICVANHTSRWDGPVLGTLINRPSTFMVHPNELKGLQGALLRKVGAFPANPKLDFAGFVAERFRHNEPFVIFPEGNVFYDGQTHPFKKGVAKVAMMAAKNDLDVPIVPLAVGYQWTKRRIIISVGAPISVMQYRDLYDENPVSTSNHLVSALHREVLALRAELGFEADRKQLLSTQVKSGFHFLTGTNANLNSQLSLSQAH
ncbi:MAG: 1-acyl-sn-glycerol-3-phosphate acyltransferase [Cyanobacteria bacterium SZAS LIN-3]|nr:1-acyl-sn-glycerol-3-phosphate acyltransferase [Cyanobacteria bacterium SZAS LIN-3]